MERKVADFFTESLIQSLDDFLYHCVEVVFLKLFPRFFVAVDFIIQEVLFNKPLDHELFVLFCFFRHGIFDFAHLLDDFLFGIFPEAFNGLVKFKDRVLTGGHFLSVEILTALIKVITVVTILHILIDIIIQFLFIIHLIKDLEVIVIFQLGDHLKNFIILKNLDQTAVSLSRLLCPIVL